MQHLEMLRPVFAEGLPLVPDISISDILELNATELLRRTWSYIPGGRGFKLSIDMRAV